MKTIFRGVFLTCADPEKTAEFYRELAGLALGEVGNEEYSYWVMDADGVQIALHDAEAFADYSSPPDPGSNLTHLYFRITDQQEFLAEVQRLGASLIDVDEVVVTVEDPDGRKVMFGTA